MQASATPRITGPLNRRQAAQHLQEQLNEAIRLLDADATYNRHLLQHAEAGDASDLARLLANGPYVRRSMQTYGRYVPSPRLTNVPVPQRLRPDLDGLVETMCHGIITAGPAMSGVAANRYTETLHLLLNAGCRDREINGLTLRQAIDAAWGDAKRGAAVERLLACIDRWTDGPAERERLNVSDAARMLGINAPWLWHVIKKSGIPAETVDGRNTYRRSDIEALESIVTKQRVDERREQAFDDLMTTMGTSLRALLNDYDRSRNGCD